MRSTVARRLSTLASFYRFCHVEGVLRRNSAANVRRPKVDHESRTLGLDRNELSALLVQAGLGTARDHALIALLALNGLRISEALGADIGDLDTDRGRRTLWIVRKGGKHVTIPHAPRTARALDLYVGERTVGPIFTTVDGGGWTARRLTAPSNGWLVGLTRGPRCAMTVAVNPWTGTPRMSSPPSSPAPPGRADPTSGRVIPGTGTARPRRKCAGPLPVEAVIIGWVKSAIEPIQDAAAWDIRRRYRIPAVRSRSGNRRPP
jgi:hypothetical protein